MLSLEYAGQYYDYWCPGDKQDISSRDFDLWVGTVHTHAEKVII